MSNFITLAFYLALTRYYRKLQVPNTIQKTRNSRKSKFQVFQLIRQIPERRQNIHFNELKFYLSIDISSLVLHYCHNQLIHWFREVLNTWSIFEQSPVPKRCISGIKFSSRNSVYVRVIFKPFGTFKRPMCLDPKIATKNIRHPPPCYRRSLTGISSFFNTQPLENPSGPSKLLDTRQ